MPTMATTRVCALLFLLPLFLGVCGRKRETLDDMMNICKDGKFHKYRASPEQELYGLCTPWSELSCCTANISRELNVQKKWHNFGYDHCPGHTMSTKCRSRFLTELCFNQCSPNLGPWLEETQKKNWNERFASAPLCASDCETWWGECREEYTCLANWAEDFSWTEDGNQCPVGTPCRKFAEIFGNATSFCEVIWNFGWKVVPDNQPCLSIYFNGSNPNRQLAETFAKEKLGISGTAPGFRSSVALVGAGLVFKHTFVWVL